MDFSGGENTGTGEGIPDGIGLTGAAVAAGDGRTVNGAGHDVGNSRDTGVDSPDHDGNAVRGVGAGEMAPLKEEGMGFHSGDFTIRAARPGAGLGRGDRTAVMSVWRS